VRFALLAERLVESIKAKKAGRSVVTGSRVHACSRRDPRGILPVVSQVKMNPQRRLTAPASVDTVARFRESSKTPLHPPALDEAAREPRRG
jgi:hypothetical protein